MYNYIIYIYNYVYTLAPYTQSICNYQLLVVCHVLTMPGPLNPQDGLTPLMLAAQFGNLSVAKLLVETYCCDVNEKSSDKVSGNYTKWE